MRRYSNVLNPKYPFIPKELEDIYIFTGIGDRYDTLAQTYYNDSTLWWVISSTNYSLEQNSLIPPIGSQIRIPAVNRISGIIAEMESQNF